MKLKFNNQTILLGVIIVLVLLIVGGGFFFLSAKNNRGANTTTSSTDSSGQDQTVGTLQPSDIGLQLQMDSNKQKIKFIASKLDGVKQLEWNFMYDADIPVSDRTADNVGSKVTQQFGSDQPVNVEGKSSYESPFRELGTCSSGHCRYDTGIAEVKIVMKVTKSDGKVYQINDSISL